MNVKKQARLRRAASTRNRIKEIGATRLAVHRTPKHIYAQVTTSCGAKVLAAASTLDKEVKESIKYSGNSDAAKAVGQIVAKRARDAGVKTVAFDRSGFLYHGRVKALADGAREAGLEF